MSKKLRELQARKAAAAKAKADALSQAGALLEKASLTEAEQAQFESFKKSSADKGDEIERIQAQIDIEQDLIAASAQAGTVAVLPGNGSSAHVTDNRAEDPKRGFKSSGEYFKAVFDASMASKTGKRPDERLSIGAAAPTTYGNEGAGADGGFAVPPQYAKDIFTLTLGDEALLPYCDNVELSESNTMSFPRDETTPWGTDGIRAYWQGEAASGNQTKHALGLNTLRLKKLMALVPVSDELLSDTSALTTYLPKKIGVSIRWKTNEAILFGAGGNVPSGAMASGAALTIAKENGQNANTLLPANVAKMIAALPQDSFPNAVWVINNDVLPALLTLNNTYQLIYMPYGGGQGAFQGSPYGVLFGRPIIVSQHAKSFSSAGDVNLLDLSYYQAITKAGGVEMASSMHLYFDADATAFRAIFRMDGLSKLSKAITPANGTSKLSPFVTLGAR